ncbi:HNH endonuclease [Rhodococcoides fascians]|nr:HNH endonuclease signature motif containing protein [Rhodococcus fascians]
MADTVCAKDPRGKQERLCDAFMARMHGEPRLTCLCQRAGCPKKDAELPDRRVPLTMVTVDIATLIGLLANPAYLAGHGSIDPDLARELARNSQWQILLTEAVTLAETLGLAVQNPETGEWERRSAEPTDTTDTTDEPNSADPEPAQPNSAESNVAESNATESNTPPAHADTRTDTGTSTATRSAAPTDNATEKSAPADTAAPTTHTDSATKNATDNAERVDDAGPGPGSAAAQTDSTTVPTPPEPTVDDDTRQRRRNALASAAALFCTHTPIGRGARHSSALDLPSMIRSNRRIMHTPAGIYLGNASLAAALEAAIAADPTLGTSVGRDPLTDRALIYRPDALTIAAVRLRDRHCRFPGCHRPAARCQLDHVIPFDHANPLGGGWTTVNNLQCLCEYHHSVKTAGYWTAVMLPGGAILWTSTSKTTRITLPANGTTVPIIGNDLRPHIPTQPRRSGVIAYPDPPDNPTPEPEPTNEEDEEPPF